MLFFFSHKGACCHNRGCHNGNDQKKDSLANGEIGIFYLNGNTYIKELHDEPDGVYLISLNQKYRPIQVLESDSFKIFGKVIGKCKGAEIPGFH